MRSSSLRGARTHNLAGIDLELRSGEVVVVTGVSGSGKSSLAFDTVYAEGQRRFIESYSPYARQFLERLERPPIDSLEPVPAGIAVDRRSPVKSSRSTVATMTDIEPYLAALFHHEALPLCPEHGLEAVEVDAESASADLVAGDSGAPLLVGYPLRVDGVESYLTAREELLREGYRRVWLPEAKGRGGLCDVQELPPSRLLAAGGEAFVVVDRLRAVPNERARLATALESAWHRGDGVAHVQIAQRTRLLRRGLSCPRCGRREAAPVPGLFSYESPLGACSTCRGFGRVLGIDLDKVIPDPSRSLREHAIRPWSTASTSWERGELHKACRRHRIPLDVPWAELSATQRRVVLEGDGGWEDGLFAGVLGWFKWLEGRTYKMHVRVLLARYRAYEPCPSCGGGRLGPAARAYRVGGLDLVAWHALTVSEVGARLAALEVRNAAGRVARDELERRVDALARVGLGYLTLDRQGRTLSGGEAQRVTLTAALGSSLHHALFVLDEPTVGLHPTDVEPLITAIRDLAERDNTVLVVEHDPRLIRAADRVVELGPGAGTAGGRLTLDGTVAEALRAGGATARALAGGSAPSSRAPRPARGWLEVRGASANNLRDLDVDFPLGVLCVVSGPSGSGKSTLVVDLVHRSLGRQFGNRDLPAPGAHRTLTGLDRLRGVALVDQTPLGRTSRGNAATYTKAWDPLRRRFAAEPAAVAQQLTASSFSFNVAAGRCPACAGEGFETVEMQFLADVRLVCPVCRGQRFQAPVLAVRHRGRSVADLLGATVAEVLADFADDPAVQRALGPVGRLGLGYLQLGQPLSTLSGGEAQRLKLARALGERAEGTLFVLDEPSVGLHADEVGHLLAALDGLVQAGGSVIVVDHDLGVLRAADHIIDLGPGAGAQGGRVVAAGPPSAIERAETRTGAALRAAASLTASVASAAVGADAAHVSERPLPELRVTRAREHNLREVTVRVPHRALTVVTGPSGSGKSTLAFDVIFAEGQRRFLETLTPYARHFLPALPRPRVDAVVGVPPAIALEQRTSRAGPRSTVATVTEVAHYLRLLYAKLGVPHCPDHDLPIQSRSAAEVLAAVRRLGGRGALLAPALTARKGQHLELFAAAARAGIASAICDGEPCPTGAPPRLARTREHTIELVIGEDLPLSKLDPETLERALLWGQGALEVVKPGVATQLFSTRRTCPRCARSIPELDPRWFSFNTVQGRCPRCEGTGRVPVAARQVVAVRQGDRPRARRPRVGDPAEMPTERCPDCAGARLAPVPSAVRVGALRFAELTACSVAETLAKIRAWRVPVAQRPVAQPILGELVRRLRFLSDVGLEYLSLDRAATSLSGGEMQRLRLAAQLGAGLSGALYVLDEPTIGLHPRDTGRLIENLRRLVALGSTVLVVEHDEDLIRAADHLIDLGPGGGTEGGEVMAEGPHAAVLAEPRSPTGRALRQLPALRASRPLGSGGPRLVLGGVTEHNLKAVRLTVPLGAFTVVAGVSGSGKSTLVGQVLLPAVQAELGLVGASPGAHRTLKGAEALRRAVAVDQSPIGRTPRSVPATYLGIWDRIRQLFAATAAAQIAGFAAARFSFNTASGGRCPACEGQGVVTHEMGFLPDVTTPCMVCGGARFEPRTLAVRYLGLSIAEVLSLTAAEAAERFANHPSIAGPLRTLVELGAGYITLGQGSQTLSGGEAQRLKLAVELTAGKRHEPTLYVLDEPTTGLHLADVAELVAVLGRLVERGDTLVVIEHHPLVIGGADWVVELGPEGGERGGRIVAEGPPAAVALAATATGRVLREVLAERPHVGARKGGARGDGSVGRGPGSSRSARGGAQVRG